MHNFTLKLTVNGGTSILKILRRNQVEIDWSLICHRNLVPKKLTVKLQESNCEMLCFSS